MKTSKPSSGKENNDSCLHAQLGNPYDGLLPLNEKEAIVEVRGIEVAYRSSISVLAGIYCHFQKNRVTAILGPSGCGKSTLIKTLNRTLELIPGTKVLAGTVFYHGKDIYDPQVDPQAVRKHIGIIHQRPIIFPMSILKNVIFGARFHEELRGSSPQEYAEHFLDCVGLLEEVKDRLKEPAGRLSGGQQQRLCLARTLANRPDVILMDEPCSAIDPVATQKIEELICELKKEYTIIIVTHNMQQAKRVSDHTVFMLGGRIVEAGETKHLFATPKTELAKKFLSGSIG
tara:strand:+ start:364 stop:1224 length:861 start_codon:yes stop_codon:yes gene_type:complete